MTVDTVRLRDVLDNASCKEAYRDKSVAIRERNIAYGRGVLVGVVAGLMFVDMSFDEAWELCLNQNIEFASECVPPSWPSKEDYEKSRMQDSTNGGK